MIVYTASNPSTAFNIASVTISYPTLHQRSIPMAVSNRDDKNNFSFSNLVLGHSFFLYPCQHIRQPQSGLQSLLSIYIFPSNLLTPLAT